MFIAACEGYLVKEEDHLMLMRKVAQASFYGNHNEFNKWWPMPGESEVKQMTWGSKEEALEMQRKIQEAHGIKLTPQE